MNDDQQIAERRAPFGAAMFAGLVSWMLIYWVSKNAVSRLEVWWAEWLVYALIPVWVVFAILYRSGWHREMAGAVRTLSLLALSCVTLGGALAAGGLIALAMSVVLDGFTKIHY